MQKTELENCRYFRAVLKETTQRYLKGKASIRELNAVTNTAGKYLALLITEIVEEKRMKEIPANKLIDV